MSRKNSNPLHKGRHISNSVTLAALLNPRTRLERRARKAELRKYLKETK